MVEGHVPQGVGVQVPPSAQESNKAPGKITENSFLKMKLLPCNLYLKVSIPPGLLSKLRFTTPH
jgi:hypothetical protein